MKNKITLFLLAVETLCAGGYKVPETSLNAIALSAANVAHSHGAENAYSNPANMVFMEDRENIEVDLISIGLAPVEYKSENAPTDIHAKKENFLLPSLHYVSKKLGTNARIGLTIVVPGGLSKRWSDSPAVERAKEFTLEVTEINPTTAFEINNRLGVAVGLRFIHSHGVVKSVASASRDMSGGSIDVGYNLALAYKPTTALEFGLTYRSKVDLTVQGNAKLYIGNAKVYDGDSSVTVPLPATIDAAIAYTFPTQTTVEFVYERVNWSAYKKLDFNYLSDIPTILQPSFDDAIRKDWKDTSVYRVGITQQIQSYTLMAGMVRDESPIPERSLSFELPDADSISVSGGVRYQYSKNLNIGFAGLYSMRERRSIRHSNGIEGDFSNTNVLILSAGFGYKF